MAFRKITEGDMLGKGNVGRPDTPGVSTAEMQRILDELPREVLAPIFNENIEELERLEPVSYTHLDVYKRQELIAEKSAQSE